MAVSLKGYKMARTFGNSKKYQQQKAFKKRLNKVITGLIKLLKQYPNAVKTVQRFRGCLENPQNDDAGRLPLYAINPYVHKKSKIDAVLVKLSILVQNYWSYYNTKSDTLADLVDKQTANLEEIIKIGLVNYKLTGKKYPGYLLEKR